MKLHTFTIAYLPRPHEELMDLTRRSLRTTEQFKELGPVVAYHADTAYPAPGNCERTHACFESTPILEYVNGGLIHNWGVGLRRGFDEGADWVMFVSNDVFWHDRAVASIRDIIERSDPKVYHLGWPTAVFLMSRRLWDLLQPNWYDGYPPAGLDDIELACQVLAAGGEMRDHGLDQLFDHPVLSNTGTMLGLDRHGDRPSTAPGCAEQFRRRWVPPMRFEPNSESVVWPPTREQVADIRAHPRRPYP